MTEFKPGEIVDITIKGAQVDEVGRNGLHVVMPNGTTAHIELSNYEGVTVERVAPAEWPPREDDLWRDGNGIVWFGVAVSSGEVSLMNSRGLRLPVDQVVRDFGPLAFVHREDEQDGGTR